jgi:hypothetical protein
MLFMVIEHFKDVKQVGERFARSGRMLPTDVIYHASWVDAATNRCFQVMEAPNRESVESWIDRWDDLIDFEVVPVVTSSDFWSQLS